MSTTTSLEALEAAVEECVWQQLRVLADWHEEHGNGELAEGYRWLAENHKRPYHSMHGYRMWASGVPRLEYGLPAAVMDPQAGSVPGVLPATMLEHVTQQDAYRAAAQAIGAQLRQDRERPRTLLACIWCGKGRAVGEMVENEEAGFVCSTCREGR